MSGARSGRTRELLDRAASRMLSASVLERVAIAAASTLLALFIGLIIVAAAGYDPLVFVNELVLGAFGSQRYIARTLTYTTIFVLTGVAVAIAFRAGVFNIGVQGQFIAGGFSGVMSIVWLAPFLPEGAIGGAALLVVGMIVAMIGGGLYGALPGVLKAYYGANEIITTIMLNFIATGIVAWLLSDSSLLRADGINAPNTENIPEYVSLPQIVFEYPDFALPWFIVTLLVVAIVTIIMERTGFGYDMVTSGYQEAAAVYSGVGAKRTIVATMTFSGMVAGIAGVIYAIMIQGYFTDPNNIPTFGFDAIAVSLLAANNPIGVVPAGLLFGALESAGSNVRINTDVPLQLIEGIVGLVVLFVAAPELFRMAAKRTNLGDER